MCALGHGDLRGGKVDNLNLNVCEFASKEKFRTCRKELSFVEILYRVEEEGLHCVWVIDPEGGLVGVVTLTDIIKKFL